eukprot:TRINITY_DN99690_c0_g1_i1.p1 TRINITY_DN99690_c0_g1~~TRINITY_DN99690_c0_g1_i1.p1  ORF type:complete len:397 (-),score=62.26 TRINITY_DN99690_c0_g1_i1:64-1206(-)
MAPECSGEEDTPSGYCAASCPAMSNELLEKCLHSIIVGGRKIEYALAGEEEGEPVLLFYPMGASRSMAALFDWPAKRVGARLICLNRPGMGQATPSQEGNVRHHVESHCKDIVACMDHLGYDRVRVLFLCAGAPFALAFRARHPERTKGRLVGCSAWVSPTDCPNARLLYRISAGLPTNILTTLAGTFANSTRSCQSDVFSSMTSMTSSLPSSMPNISNISNSSMLSSLDDTEAKKLLIEQTSEETSQDDIAFLMACCGPLASGFSQETGGEGADAATLVHSAAAWGVDYGQLGCALVLLHGEDDTTVPIECADWTQKQIPGTIVRRVPGAQHGETMLLGISAALRILLPRRAVDAKVRNPDGPAVTSLPVMHPDPCAEL